MQHQRGYITDVESPEFTIRPLVNPQQVIFRISGYEERVVLIDEVAGRYVERHRPCFYSQTDLMYRYIVQNPNRIITLDELKKDIDRRYLSLNFTKVISGLKFTGKLRQLFFRASQSHLIFFNPITIERMMLLNIRYEDIIPYMVEPPRQPSLPAPQPAHVLHFQEYLPYHVEQDDKWPTNRDLSPYDEAVNI